MVFSLLELLLFTSDVATSGDEKEEQICDWDMMKMTLIDCGHCILEYPMLYISSPSKSK